MRGLVVGVLALSAGWSGANDGVFYASGNGLVPKAETVVELRKEVLKLTRVGRDMEVSVDFTFFNPGPPKTETVGFVTPPADGDVLEVEKSHPQISNFTVVVNDRPLRYEARRMEGSGFQVREGDVSGDDFVYHFEVPFKKGENRIKHSYKYRGGGGVDLENEFLYRLTTGKAWANKVIGDFTLEIDLGRGAYFAIPSSFKDDGELVKWEATGGGKLSKPRIGPFQNRMRMYAEREGVLRMKAKDFAPDFDLSLVQFRTHMEVQYWKDDPKDLPIYLQDMAPMMLFPGGMEEEQLKEMDGRALRFVRNYFYARKGYVFKDPVLARTFGQFLWYDPQPGKAVELSQAEKEYVALIKRVEKAK